MPDASAVHLLCDLGCLVFGAWFSRLLFGGG